MIELKITVDKTVGIRTRSERPIPIYREALPVKEENRLRRKLIKLNQLRKNLKAEPAKEGT